MLAPPSRPRRISDLIARWKAEQAAQLAVMAAEGEVGRARMMEEHAKLMKELRREHEEFLAERRRLFLNRTEPPPAA
jgi:hypothetical protein